MKTEIGAAAGRIWQYRAEHGATTLPQLQRGTTLPERLMQMGVGWLAREDKLCFVQERGVVKLALHPAPRGDHGTVHEKTGPSLGAGGGA